MHSPRIRNKRGMFCFDRSIIKRTLRGEQSTFSAVSRFPWEGFSWSLTPHNQHAYVATGVIFFAIDRSIIKNILLQEQSTFGVYLSFRRKDGHETSYFALPTRELQTL
jgi:hypothetical protein